MGNQKPLLQQHDTRAPHLCANETTTTTTTNNKMTTKATLIALALALAAAILCVAQAQVDVGAAAKEAILSEVNRTIGSDFLCVSGSSSGFIDALNDRSSGGLSSLLNSIFGLGVEQGYRWATSSGPLSNINGLTGC